MPDDLLTKNEAAILLDSTPRGIENWVAKKKLTPVFIEGKHGKEWRFNRLDIEEFKKQRSEVQYVPIRQPGHSLAIQPELIERLVVALEGRKPQKSNHNATISLTDKHLLTLKECAIVSGLTLIHIRSAIKQGKLSARRDGRHLLVNQNELQRYTSEWSGNLT